MLRIDGVSKSCVIYILNLHTVGFQWFPGHLYVSISPSFSRLGHGWVPSKRPCGWRRWTCAPARPRPWRARSRDWRSQRLEQHGQHGRRRWGGTPTGSPFVCNMYAYWIAKAPKGSLTPSSFEGPGAGILHGDIFGKLREHHLGRNLRTNWH